MTAPTSTQIRVMHEAGMHTRLDSSPAREKPEKRYCAEPDCDTLLCSFNEGDKCSLCGGWPSSPVTPMEHRDAFAALVDDDEGCREAEGLER